MPGRTVDHSKTKIGERNTRGQSYNPPNQNQKGDSGMQPTKTYGLGSRPNGTLKGAC